MSDPIAPAAAPAAAAPAAAAPATPEQPLIYRIPAPLLIAGASAAGYWLAHTYESAYLAYFGLPAGLVRVSLNTAIWATGALLSVGVGALFTTAFLTGSLSRDHPHSLIALAFVLLVFAGFVYVDLAHPSVWVPVLLTFIAMFGGYGIHAGIEALETRSAKRQASQVSWRNPFHAWVIPWIGWDLFHLAVVLFLAHLLAQIIGDHTARNETRFLTLQDPHGFVVLRAYDETAIAASFDWRAHTVGPDVLILNSKMGMLRAKYEEVGPLKRR